MCADPSSSQPPSEANPGARSPEGPSPAAVGGMGPLGNVVDTRDAIVRDTLWAQMSLTREEWLMPVDERSEWVRAKADNLVRSLLDYAGEYWR